MELLPRILFRLLIIYFFINSILIFMKKSHTLVLIALLLASTLATDCPIDTKQSRIYSGTHPVMQILLA